MYLYDAWYVAAWDYELNDKPLGRTLLGLPLVLYRAADGRAVALEDRCCHRRAPLSLGSVVGNDLQCNYHGLTFDPSGACVRVPSQSTVPPGARVRAYPVVERNRWVWVWMGNPAAADPEQIPDLFWHDSPQWRMVYDRFHVKANYQNLIDIQLDQTHSRYVHPTTLGNAGALATSPKVKRNPRTVECERLMPNADAPPIWAKLGGFKGSVDHWIKWVYYAPGAIAFDVGVYDVGTGAFEGNLTHGISVRNSHACTPETATTTHHFWVASRNFKLDDDAIHGAISGIRNTFLEDVAIVEATERRIADDPSAPTIDVNADNPTIQARRLVARLIEEAAASRAAE